MELSRAGHHPRPRRPARGRLGRRRRRHAGPAPDRIAGLVRRARPDLFLYLGDVYETGTRSEFRRFYHPRFGPLAGITMPTLGNHEWRNRFTRLLPVLGRQKGHKQPPWSKRTIAGWQILDLNSQAPHGTSSPQVSWLESTLAGARGDCRIAFWHRPRYSEGAYGGAPDLNPLWNRLAGHAQHRPERPRPQPPAPPPAARHRAVRGRRRRTRPLRAARRPLHHGLGPRRRERRAPHRPQARPRPPRVPRRPRPRARPQPGDLLARRGGARGQ